MARCPGKGTSTALIRRRTDGHLDVGMGLDEASDREDDQGTATCGSAQPHSPAEPQEPSSPNAGGGGLRSASFRNLSQFS